MNQTHGDNECDIFGKHVAMQLKQLPTVLFLQAQQDIQNILTNYRLRTQRTGSTTVSGITYSSSPDYIFPTVSNSSSQFTSRSTPSLVNGTASITESPLGSPQMQGDIISQAWTSLDTNYDI